MSQITFLSQLKYVFVQERQPRNIRTIPLKWAESVKKRHYVKGKVCMTVDA